MWSSVALTVCETASVFPKEVGIPFTHSHLGLGAPLPWIRSGGLWVSCVFLALPSYNQNLPAGVDPGCSVMGGQEGCGASLHVSDSALPLGFSHNKYRPLSLEGIFPSHFEICQVKTLVPGEPHRNGVSIITSAEFFVQCWRALQCCDFFVPVL